MKVNQIKTIINNAAKQAFGQTAPEVQDLTGLYAMGDTVMSTKTNKEEFWGAVCDKVGKQVTVNRKYTREGFRPVMDTFEFGAALEKIRVGEIEATDNAAWTLKNGDPLNPPTANIPEVKAKLFSVKNTYRFEVTLPDYQVNSAFTSFEAMAAVISCIYTAIDNAFEKAEESQDKLSLCNLFADAIDYQEKNPGNGIHAINLLEEYNMATHQGLSRNDVLNNVNGCAPAFWQFAQIKISDTLNAMKAQNSLFNLDGNVNFVPDSRLNFLMLSKAAAAFDSYFSSGVYHNDLVKMPGYQKVLYWQGIGNNTFDECSTINVVTSDGNAVNKSGIIAAAFDTEAVGIMFSDPRTDVYVDVNHDVTHIMYKGTNGYFNDLGEDVVVFYLGEDGPGPMPGNYKTFDLTISGLTSPLEGNEVNISSPTIEPDNLTQDTTRTYEGMPDASTEIVVNCSPAKSATIELTAGITKHCEAGSTVSFGIEELPPSGGNITVTFSDSARAKTTKAK